MSDNNSFLNTSAVLFMKGYYQTFIYIGLNFLVDFNILNPFYTARITSVSILFIELHEGTLGRTNQEISGIRT